MKVGDIVEKKYELVRLLGRGGMGEVYEGRHLQIGRRVALKFLHPSLATEGDLVLRFLREAKAAAAIGSEHIVEIYDLGESPEGAPFLVMEFLDGEDLGRTLRRERRLEPPRAAGLMLQTCHGLAAAHDAGIIHRDLKPDNLFLTQREGFDVWVKLVDFGIAKFRDALTEVNPRLTETGVSLGTPFYMSPEQATGESDIDHRTDIYSMGVILYELLSGRVPYLARSYSQLIYKLATETPLPLRELRPELPAELEALVLRSMAREREERFEAVADLAEALEPFCEPGPAPGPTALRPSGPRADSGQTGDEDQVRWDEPTRPARAAGPPPGPPPGADSPSPPLPDAGRGGGERAESEEDRGDKAAPVIEKPRGRTSPRLIGAAVFGALLIAAGALAVAFWSRGPAGDESAPSPRAADEVAPSDARETRETGPAASAAPAEPDLVAIRLQGVPEGARVFLDGLPTESTTLHLRRSPEVRRVKVTLEGRAPWERLVTAEEDRIIPVELPSPPGATEPDAGTGEAPRPGRRPPRSETNREGIPQLRTRFPEGR